MSPLLQTQKNNSIKKKLRVHFQDSLPLSTTCFGKPGQSNFWEKVPGKSFCHKTRHTSDYVLRHSKCSTVCYITLVNNSYKVFYRVLLHSGTLFVQCLDTPSRVQCVTLQSTQFCIVFRHSNWSKICYTKCYTDLHSV